MYVYLYIFVSQSAARTALATHRSRSFIPSELVARTLRSDKDGVMVTGAEKVGGFFTNGKGLTMKKGWQLLLIY